MGINGVDEVVNPVHLPSVSGLELSYELLKLLYFSGIQIWHDARYHNLQLLIQPLVFLGWGFRLLIGAIHVTGSF